MWSCTLILVPPTRKSNPWGFNYNGAFVVIQINSRLKSILNDISSNSVCLILEKWNGHSLKWQEVRPGWRLLTTLLMSYRGEVKKSHLSIHNQSPNLRHVLFWIYWSRPFLSTSGIKKMAHFFFIFAQSKQLVDNNLHSQISFWSYLFIIITRKETTVFNFQYMWK